MSPREFMAGTHRAHELYGDFWFNTEPIPLLGLRGNVVLMEFWDFTCPSSLRMIPYLEAWKTKYADAGLVIVGVHVPRFTFGRDPIAVERALTRLGVTYPVLTDNEQVLWSRYEAREWPTRYVIDKDGFIRAQFSGGGNALVIEHMLQTMLCDAGGLTDFPDPVDPLYDVDRPGAVICRATPELRAGYLRGSIGNVEGSVPESATRYTDPFLYLEGRLYLSGTWRSGRESLTLEETGSLIVNYSATEVTAVLRAPAGQQAVLNIVQDSASLTDEHRGRDVVSAPDGQTVVTVEEPRLYHLVRNREVGEHILRLTSGVPGTEVYGFGFLGGTIPEFVQERRHAPRG